MKCVSCGTEVAPNFVAAILKNSCPACGEKLIASSEFNKMMTLKRSMESLNLDLKDNDLVKVSAALCSKFEIWPKDMDASLSSEDSVSNHEIESVEEDLPPPSAERDRSSVPKPRKLKRLSDNPSLNAVGGNSSGVNDSEPEMSDEELQQLIEETGLMHGDIATSSLLKDHVPSDPMLNAMLGGVKALDDDIPASPFLKRRKD